MDSNQNSPDDVCDLLVFVGANPNLRNNYGKKALDLAQESNYRRIIEMLISTGTFETSIHLENTMKFLKWF